MLISKTEKFKIVVTNGLFSENRDFKKTNPMNLFIVSSKGINFKKSQ